MPEESEDPHEVARRPILKAVTGAAVVGGLGAATRLGWLYGAPDTGLPGGGRPLLQLSANQGGMQTLELPLGDDLLPRLAPGVWRSTHLSTSTH
jgi:hypothetical protein